MIGPLRRWLRGERHHSPSNLVDEQGLFQLFNLRDSSRRAENIRAIRARCQSVYQGNSIAVCRVLGRFPMFVSTEDRRLGVRMQMDGYWEPEISEWISRIARPGKHMIDVGANYGYFTLLMAGLVGPDGKVWAFEPNPPLASLLKQTVRVCGLKRRIKVRQVALGADHNELAFHQNAESPMNARLLRGGEQDLPSVAVKVKPLDDLIPAGTRIDFIKVDIEGAEHAFWRGAQRVISENPQIEILMEVNHRRYDEPKRFFTEITDNGFDLCEIKPPTGKLQRVTAKQLLDPATKGHRMLLLRRASGEQAVKR